MKEAQEIAELVTVAEMQIGAMLKEIPKANANQYKSATSAQNEKAKTETVADLGFSKDQVSQFQRIRRRQRKRRPLIIKGLHGKL